MLRVDPSRPPDAPAAAAAAAAAPAAAWLVPISGPPLRAVELKLVDDRITIGRHDTCDVRLPSDAVSRLHARLRCEHGHWRLADLGSRWGTFLNGCRITPDKDIPLQAGDLIRISPWTFNFSASVTSRRTVHAANDVEQCHTLVRSQSADSSGAMTEDLLPLFLEAAASLHAATDEAALAEALIEAACRGSGLPNAAVVRPIDALGEIEVIATRLEDTSQPTYSRTLLAAAANGQVAEFPPAHGADGSQSIIGMNVGAALCVPLMLGPTAAAYLYLDARGGRGPRESVLVAKWNAAVSFCLALGRIASLALANLKRIDMERRAALIEMELRAAAEAQRWILPRRQVEVGSCHCFGESRPGRFVGGDFFDIVPISDGRIALALGDVAGKGVPASLLMTAAQGFLNAALSQDGRLDSAVSQLNRFLSPRRPDDRFLTLWAGVLDPAKRLLHYIDAGHGYAFLLAPGQPPQMLNAGDNLPLGVSEQAEYIATAVPLPASGQLLVVSDGIIEQPAPARDDAPGRVEFGADGVRAVAGQLGSHSDPIGAVFDAVFQHSGGSALLDDATVLAARW